MVGIYLILILVCFVSIINSLTRRELHKFENSLNDVRQNGIFHQPNTQEKKIIVLTTCPGCGSADIVQPHLSVNAFFCNSCLNFFDSTPE